MLCQVVIKMKIKNLKRKNKKDFSGGRVGIQKPQSTGLGTREGGVVSVQTANLQLQVTYGLPRVENSLAPSLATPPTYCHKPPLQ